MEPDKSLKVGNLLLLTKASNGQHSFVGKILRVVKKGGNYTCVDEETGNQTSIYWTIPHDIYIKCNRTNILKFKKNKLVKLQKDIKKLENDVKGLEKYPTEEAFEAHCIKEIFKNKDDEQAIVKVLKLMGNLRKVYY